MVNIISKNGMFFKEIPFNLENAKAIQSGTKRGFCVLDNGVCSLNVRIIATDIRDKEYPIVVAVDYGDEAVARVTESGTSTMDGSLRIYVPTRINTYENFIPSLYQSCLIRDSNNKMSTWTIDVCSGYKDDGKTPTFFGREDDIAWEYVPLCKATLPLKNLWFEISWNDYVKKYIVSHDED